MNTVGEKIATLTERVSNLSKETNDRHLENKEILNKIYLQTTRTNGNVSDIQSWREAHEVVTVERMSSNDVRLDNHNERITTLENKVSTINEERIQRIGANRILLLLWAPVSALMGAIVSHIFPVIEKAIGTKP